MTSIADILLLISSLIAALTDPYPTTSTKMNQLMVRYNLVPDTTHETSYIYLPRNTTAASSWGWSKVSDYSDYLSIWCDGDDYRVCTLYDLKGTVAGIQLSRLQTLADDSDLPISYADETQWISQTFMDKSVYSTITLFIDEDTIESGGRTYSESMDTAPNGVYVVLQNSSTQHIPLDQSDATSSSAELKEQSCFVGMGKHYFQIDSTMTCEEGGSYFGLYGKETATLHGLGILQWGNVSVGRNETSGGWFETPAALVVKMIAPDTPSCLTTWVNKYGLYTMHVFFAEDPTKISCKSS